MFLTMILLLLLLYHDFAPVLQLINLYIDSRIANRRQAASLCFLAKYYYMEKFTHFTCSLKSLLLFQPAISDNF